MEKQSKSVALLDANVLYSAPIRDLLPNLADAGLYLPKWTELIHDEWIQNLLSNRPELKLHSLNAAKNAMNAAFPDADIKDFFQHAVTPYLHLISGHLFIIRSLSSIGLCSNRNITIIENIA
jgi:hypothetical protein